MEAALWVLVVFCFLGALATFVFFVGGAFVAWIADMMAWPEDDE